MRPIPAEAKIDVGFRFSMPAPVGGWNARDSLAQMAPRDALILDNFFPNTTDVEFRQGSASEASVTSGESIQTLMGLANQDGSFKRFAASQTGIWNITAGGAIGAVDSAATSGKWEHTQVNVAGVSYLWACCGDGSNKARVYNGTTAAWTVLDAASSPVLTGLNSEDIANVSQFKNRLILCEKGSLSFWYGPLNSVGGAFTEFDLGSIFKLGGYLMATTSWTVDAGDGMDDHFAAISSEGEVVIYKGTDPSASSTFALVGVFMVGKPTGRRCMFKLSGDVGILTEQGLWPISRALLSATVDKRVALTDKIQRAFNSYYSLYSSQFGWQATLLPKGPAIIVNVPYSATQSYQFVMNTMTGAWCRFLGWNATCMLVQDGKFYFAAQNAVTEGWTGTADGSSAITCSAAMAFSYGPSRIRGKKINMVKPILQASAPLAISMALDTDFAQREALTTTISAGAVGDVWDTAIWDTSTWADGSFAINKWKTVRHRPGGSFSLRLRVQPKDISGSWASTDFLGEMAGLAT